MQHTLRFVCLGALLLFMLVENASAALRSRRVATGLDSPLFATAAPGDDGRLFIAEREGLIKIFDRNTETVLDTPFIDLSPRVSTYQAGGLLGMAFHPDYANNGQYYVYYINNANNSQISRFTVSSDPNISPQNSGTYVMDFDRQRATHTGGWIGFSPVDDYLYILSGDGGGHNDPFMNAQDTSNLLGSVLRIDVNGDDFPGDMFNNYSIPADNPFVGTDAAPETWAYGLRNPWRGSFDSATGDLIFGDVGQDYREEVNFQRADSTGGANYGWPLREGTIATPTADVGGPRPPDNVDPIYDYAHGDGKFEGHSVTGGYVYRGPDPEMQGKYFFADYSTGKLWSIDIDRDTETFVSGSLKDWTGLLAPNAGGYSLTVSLAEDSNGNLYVLDIGGDMYMLEAIPEVAAAGAYLSALYSAILTRPGEPIGVSYWGSELSEGSISRGDVANSFLTSREHLAHKISNYYQTFLGRGADANGLAYWRDRLLSVGEENVATEFLSSPEFQAAHASDESFVDALYQLILNRTADKNGRDFYVGELQGGLTRADLANQFTHSRERYRSIVGAFYQRYLGREGDQAGIDFYVSQLINGAIDLNTLAQQFLTSDEFVYHSYRSIGDIDTYVAGLPFGATSTAVSTAVPEPASAALALCGGALLALRRRRR
ncbi:MAG: DUF4214 domain-containing protein [Pirellulales bacterium]|nr:DUF4214 domain-containing protein [Planctomycetales bacterium]